MALRDFIFPHSHSSLASYPLNPAPIGIKSQMLPGRGLSINSAKAKPVRKSSSGKMPSSCAWYEAEDRSMPSVSSF
ncbi:MAG: hypothetical protein NVS9B15_24660 [Acidobacteriaceae bacterium]